MLQGTLNRLIAAFYIAFVFATSVVFFIVAVIIWLLTRPFDRRTKLLHRFTCLWASLYVWIFPPWRVTVHGRDKIDPDKTYIIVSNHQSLVDILVAFMTFAHFKWVSKAELFAIPLIGWNMYLNRYIKLDRGRSRSIKQMYRACEKHLREGSSIYVFPEGTRSATGRLRPFKEGAFVLAKRLGLPILPMVINGSKNALPKASFNFHGHSDVHLEVLDEIPPGAFMEMPTTDLANMVRETIRERVSEEAAT